MEDQQGLRITRDELEAEIRRSAHGALEHGLLSLLSDIKGREGASDVFVRIEFPSDGGLALQCRRGRLSGLLWKAMRPVRLWWT